MKQQNNILLALSPILFLCGCHSSNKVVSTFGKRKYTKGYYCFWAKSSPFKKMAVSQRAPIPVHNTTAINSIVSNCVSLLPSPTNTNIYTRKINQIHLTKTAFTPVRIRSFENKITTFQTNSNQIIQAKSNKEPTYFGVFGFALAILAPVTAFFSTAAIPLATFVLLFYVASLVLCIIGLSVKTEKFKGFAIAGLVIDAIEAILVILLIIYLIEAFG